MLPTSCVVLYLLAFLLCPDTYICPAFSSWDAWTEWRPLGWAYSGKYLLAFQGLPGTFLNSKYVDGVLKNP